MHLSGLLSFSLFAQCLRGPAPLSARDWVISRRVHSAALRLDAAASRLGLAKNPVSQ